MCGARGHLYRAQQIILCYFHLHDQCTQGLVHSVCHQTPGAAVLEQRTAVAPHASCLRNNIISNNCYDEMVLYYLLPRTLIFCLVLSFIIGLTILKISGKIEGAVDNSIR